jgi:dolichyl-phosphate beta-glucosyltransferase
VPPTLSVVIPAYNEARRLGPTLDRVTEYLRARQGGEQGREGEHEVLVVDDGSTDATAARVEAHPDAMVRLVRQPENRGKGAALRRGVAESRGRRVLLCDADLSTPIQDVERLTAHLDDGADVAIGSRAAEGADVQRHQPFYRELMGKTFNRIIRMLGVRGLRPASSSNMSKRWPWPWRRRAASKRPSACSKTSSLKWNPPAGGNSSPH